MIRKILYAVSIGSATVLAGLVVVYRHPLTGSHAETSGIPERQTNIVPMAATAIGRKAPFEQSDLSRPPVSAPGKARYAIGDRLKITLFEHVDEPGGNADSRADSPAFVERVELTGEYVVQQSGYIVLPLIGAVEMEGLTTEQAAHALEAAFRRSMRRQASAGVRLVDREPVYVVGGNIKSGVFKFTPGMTVLHAVALLGAGNDERSDLYAHTEYVRELERLQKSTERLAQLLARAEALDAERANRSAQLPSRLIELVGVKKAKKALKAAVTVRKLLLDSQKPQIAMAETELAAARRERVNHTQKIEVLEENSKLKYARRNMLVELRRHGSGNVYKLLQIEGEVSEIEVRKQEERLLLSQSESRVAKAEQSLAKLEADRRFALDNELLAANSGVAELESTVSASRRLCADLRSAFYRMTTAGRNVSFEIIRRGREGAQRIKAVETTELAPGDLVKLSIAGRDEENGKI
jgi:exopolysaccharide production protein ExoF